MSDLGHLVVASQGDHEVGLFLVQHGAIVGVGSYATAKLGDAVGSDGRVLIMQGDDLDVVHGQELGQVGIVPKGVPVGHADRSDTHSHQRYTKSTG